MDRAQLLSRHAAPPAQVEGYDIQRCLGAGAYGTVWLANQKSTGKLVAIKFYQHRGGLDWALLNREVEKLAFLYTERDIVRLIDVGWDASPPYYVMEYLERGSVEQVFKKGPLAADEALRVVRDVAQALVHAHSRGILHCDLKPANVLLDSDWKVRLADFGQSRLSSEQLPALGTLFYMAPEQADLQASPDARWDVYALGALLFHLLTGSPPFRTPALEARLRDAPSLSARLDQYRQAILSSDRPAEHRRVRGVDRSLAEIIDRCLDVDPARRFPNAQAVLDAIDRRSQQRLRRRQFALSAVVPAFLMIVIAGRAVVVGRAAVEKAKDGLVQTVQAGNVYAARGAASSVLLHFGRLSRAVDEVSQNHQLRTMLADKVQPRLQEFIEETHKFYNQAWTHLADHEEEEPFESWLIMDYPRGMILARSPRSETIGGIYAWRDYFRGPVERSDEHASEPVYISRVFQSESDKLYKCALSALVRADSNPVSPVLGVLVATITTGSLPRSDEQRPAVLVGRRDTGTRQRNDTDVPLDSPIENLILFHPAYQKGDPPVRLQNEVLESLQASRFQESPANLTVAADDNYRDPVAVRSQKYRGRWIAGFAPVADDVRNTDFVVIVQQRYDEAVEPVNALVSTLLWRACTTVLGIAAVTMAALCWYVVKATRLRRSVAGTQ